MLLSGSEGLFMPTGSCQAHSLPGSVFTWVDLTPFSAIPHFLNAQHLDWGVF